MVHWMDVMKLCLYDYVSLWHSLLPPLGHIRLHHPVQSTILDPHWLSRGHLTQKKSCLIDLLARIGRCCLQVYPIAAVAVRV